MTDHALKQGVPGRAAASIVSACMSLWMFRVYGQVHWLPGRVSDDSTQDLQRVLAEVGPIRDQLDIAYRVLAVAALIWCIRSWQAEPRLAAGVASVFTGMALFCAVGIAM